MNKKIVILSVVMLFLFALVFGTNAQTPSNQINFGGLNQEASNPEDDDGPLLVTTTSIFSIPNLPAISDGTVSIASFQVEPGFTAATGSFANIVSLENQLENTPGLFLIEVDVSNNLVNNSLATPDTSVTLKVIVPASLNAVDANLEEKSFKVATVTLQLTPALGGSPTPIAGSFDVFIQRENNLEIQDADAKINDAKKQSIDDGDSIENLKPGDALDIEVEIENNFIEDSNIEIRNVDLEFDCDGTDVDVDEETTDVGSVPEGDSETESIKADIEEDAEDGNVNCELAIDGTDENGARHGDKIEFDIEIERKNHDIQIQSVDISPTTLTCDDSSLQLSVSLLNLGTSDEDEVALEVSSRTLGVQQRIVSNLELDEDDSDVEVATIAVDPRRLKAGTYAIQLQSFYDNVKVSDSEIVQVENNCDLLSSQEPQPTQPTTQPVVDSLSLEQETVRFSAGGTGSVPITVTNKESMPVEYTINLDNFEEFAESASTKSVFLNPGQSSTLFLNLRTKKDATEGKYTATVRLMKGNQIVETKSFTADVAGKAPKSKGTGISLGGEGTSRVFWIIGDIILIIIAIFFIRLIFTTGKKKKEKKMADYEAEEEFKKNF